MMVALSSASFFKMFTSCTNIWRTCWWAVNLKLNCVLRNLWVTQQTHGLCNPAVHGGVQHDYYIASIKEICIFDCVTSDAASSASWSRDVSVSYLGPFGLTCSLTSLKHLKLDVSRLHKLNTDPRTVVSERSSYLIGWCLTCRCDLE